MEEKRIIQVKRDILSANDSKADAFRRTLRERGTFFMDIMASPGAGKTTLLLALIRQLRALGQSELAVIEADLESDVDALKIKEAFEPLESMNLDWLFLENIGNLVCPAEFDTGAHCRVMLLSVPEGYDKVYKYPPMFSLADALIVTKSDYLPLNPDFKMDALREQAAVLNPDINIFVTSARTGEGIEDLAQWLMAKRFEALS